jgi:hypothetical protein
MKSQNSSSLDSTIGEIVYSLNCCSSGCDGWVHQDDQAKAQQAIKQLVSNQRREAAIEELEKLVAIREKHKFTTKPGQYLDEHLKKLRGKK